MLYGVRRLHRCCFIFKQCLSFTDRDCAGCASPRKLANLKA